MTPPRFSVAPNVENFGLANDTPKPPRTHTPLSFIIF